jgi:hypothetical protein
MTAKNALLFCLAVFGIIFVGIDACLPMWGFANLSGAMSAIGYLMLALFMGLVLGLGFILKLFYISFTAASAIEACHGLFLGGDFTVGAIFAAITFVLCALIPAVFLRK